MTKLGVYNMAKKQPKKAVKIEEIGPATTVESVVESVTDEATEHSARVGYMLPLNCEDVAIWIVAFRYRW